MRHFESKHFYLRTVPASHPEQWMAATLYFKEFCVERGKKKKNVIFRENNKILSPGSQPKITTVTWVCIGGSGEVKQRSLNTHGEMRKPRCEGRGTYGPCALCFQLR